MSLARVLIVEDYIPFRRFISCVLEKRHDVQIICEVSDGLEAVQKAEELKPDLILLDIGLPTLNGIEAARRIQRLVPESKIIFVSMESDADVVEEAIRLGVWGYVMKTRAGRDLAAAMDSVLSGNSLLVAHCRDSEVSPRCVSDSPEAADWDWH
jgi:DNA-binding NarL/FixJ family response regulator